VSSHFQETNRELHFSDCLPSFEQVTYKVTMYTGSEKGSGTDADVTVTLCGERGDSGPHKLLGMGDLFERGQVDDFGIESSDVGDLKKLRVDFLAAGTSK
jgi:hypothetical protein